MTVTLIKDCYLTRSPGCQDYMILDNGMVQRFYGLPAELVPDCGKCSAPTIVGGEIIGKYFYGRHRKVHVWCLGHVPWWVRADGALKRLGWKLFRIPAYKWPW